MASLTTSNQTMGEKTIPKSIFGQLIDNPEMAALAVNKMLPVSATLFFYKLFYLTNPPLTPCT